MAKPERSPERAEAVIERASRMSRYKASIFDRRLFDRQMRPPGQVKTSRLGNLNTLPADAIEYSGVRRVKLRDLVTDQASISVKAAKAKVRAGIPSLDKAPRVLFDGKTPRVMDGNHTITALRARGITEVEVHTWKLKGAPEPLAPKVLKRDRTGRPMKREGIRPGATQALTRAIQGRAGILAASRKGGGAGGPHSDGGR